VKKEEKIEKRQEKDKKETEKGGAMKKLEKTLPEEKSEKKRGKGDGWEEWFKKLTPGEQLNHYFRRCNHLHRCIVDKNMTKAEIYASQHRILGILDHKPLMSQKEIASVMEVSTATIAVTLKKMEKSGFIEKIMDVDDNRFNKIKMTEKGKHMLCQGFDIMHRIDFDLVKNFTEEELCQFTSLMKSYYERLVEMAEVDYTQEESVNDRGEAEAPEDKV